MNNSDRFAFQSVSELGRQLRAHETTSLALTESFLDRLERLGPKYNAVVRLTRERAIREAKQADSELKQGRDRGPLHGIPYAAKDLFSTRGTPTTWGAEPYRDRLIDEDAGAIRKLREAGAVLLAKLAMIEIAGGMGYRQANASFTGPALNPWNTDYWAGGSSSGSGAAVAAGLVPFALGTETWGSIICPAAFCGVSGLRPTYGRVSRHGAMALSWTMDKAGVLARSADDCGHVLAALSGADPLDESAIETPFVFDTKSRPDKFRLAVIKGCTDNVQTAVKTNFAASREALSQIAEIEEVELPEPQLPWNEVPSTIIDAEIAAAFEGMITSDDIWKLTAPEDRHGGHAGQMILAVDYINALRIRKNIFQPLLDEFLKPFDAVLTPSRATVAHHADKPFRESSQGYDTGNFDGGANCCGLPSITIPNGFDENQLPTGLQITARGYDDLKVLQVANAYQKLSQWHEKTPG